MKMQSPYEQMVKEKEDLDNKRVKLASSITGDGYDDFTNKHRLLVVKQLNHMASYSETLEKRIELVNSEK